MTFGLNWLPETAYLFMLIFARVGGDMGPRFRGDDTADGVNAGVGCEAKP